MMHLKKSLATLLICGLLYSLAGLANAQDEVGQDFGLTNTENLIKNSSFEEGNLNWNTTTASSENSNIIFSDGRTPHIVNFPYWEGRAAFYQPVHGKRYLEIKWSNSINSASQDTVTQEVTVPSSGKYLLIAHVRAHMGEVSQGAPNASIIISDPANGSIIRKISIYWLPARQEWILVGAVVDVKKRLKLSLGFDEAGTTLDSHLGSQTKNFSYLFDDIRLIAVGNSSAGIIDQFEKESKLNLSPTGMDTRPLYESEYLPRNFDTRKFSALKIHLAFTQHSEWKFNVPQGIRFFDSKLEYGENIVEADVTHSQAKDAFEGARNVTLPASDNRNKFSVSAWVWSDAPRAAYLALEYDSDKYANSAFHTGSGKWEYLTVVAPYPVEGNHIKITLHAETGAVKFRAPDLLVMSDDRFDGILPTQDIGGGRLRERVSFKKEANRIRIVIVGNSTVNGVASVAHHATFPYLLQLKLETLYPGKFEVINYGIGAGGLLDQIISVKNHFKFATNDTNYFVQLINPAPHSETINSLSLAAASRDAVSLAALNPDIIIIASMWNDLDRLFNWEILERDYGALPEFLRLLDTPTSETYATYQFKRNTALEMIKKKQSTLQPKNYSFTWSTNSNYADLLKDEQYYISSRRAEEKYQKLLDKFVVRALAISQSVWNLSLPANGGGKAVDYFDHFPDIMLKANNMELEKKKAIVFSRQFQGGIQSRTGTIIASKYHIPNLDLVHSYDDMTHGADSVEWSKLDYFVPDMIHFTYRGNEWIADEIFRIMEVEFGKMAQEYH